MWLWRIYVVLTLVHIKLDIALFLLCRYLKDYVKHFNLKVKYNTKVMNIGRAASQPDIFTIRLENGEVIQADVIFMACGAMKENIPNIPGIELADTYAKHDLDQNKYANRRVCVVGGGNSGFEVTFFMPFPCGSPLSPLFLSQWLLLPLF